MAVIIAAEVLNSIAQKLECGMDCWYHIPTDKVFSAPNDLKNDIDEDIWEVDFKEIEAKEKDCVYFECLETREEFRIMESFAENEVADKVAHARLITALGQRKPFGHFKSAIKNSGPYLEAWYVYKSQAYLKHVQELLDYYNRKIQM